MSELIIVMYHYVRDVARSRYPGIKAVTIEQFEKQLDFIEQKYTVTTTRAVLESTRGGHPLPPKACLLTFDDGLIDHYTTVFPRLEARGLPGSFYPPALAARGGHILDVHKIHFILAVTKEDDHEALADELLDRIEPYRSRYDNIPPADELRAKYRKPSAVGDGEATAFVKSVLQKGVEAAVREPIVGSLFDERVGIDDAIFARELYMDVAQLRTMARHGMEIGGHGVRHAWADELSTEEQYEEVFGTREFLTEVYGRPAVDWVMCYPYGCHTKVTRDYAEQAGCAFGLTTQSGIVRDLRSPLTLPRLDTKNLPPFVSLEAAFSTVESAAPHGRRVARG